MRHVLFPLVLIAAACSSGTDSNSPPAPPPPPPAPAQQVTVHIANNSFSPGEALVVVGGEVTWNWDASGHSVTSVGSPGFQSKGVSNAGTTHGPLTFNTAGTYKYICSVHGFADANGNTSGMSGSVVVGD